MSRSESTKNQGGRFGVHFLIKGDAVVGSRELVCVEDDGYGPAGVFRVLSRESGNPIGPRLIRYWKDCYVREVKS